MMVIESNGHGIAKVPRSEADLFGWYLCVAYICAILKFRSDKSQAAKKALDVEVFANSKIYSTSRPRRYCESGCQGAGRSSESEAGLSNTLHICKQRADANWFMLVRCALQPVS